MLHEVPTAARGCWLAVLAAALVMAWPLAATADPTDEDQAAAESLRDQIDATLDEFALSTVGPSSKPLVPRTVLRWDNNARGSEQGVTLLYLAEGRPEVACCIYPWDGKLVHDFRTMSRGLVEARRGEEVVWRPDQPGVAFRPIPEAAPPQESAAGRLRQLKALAGRFSGKLVGWKLDDSDRQELRLLPRPIYRYENPKGDVVDGAVFALVMGVDPEMLLVLEAVAACGAQRWEYAFVRRTSGQLEGRMDGEVVWTAERYPPIDDPVGLDRSFSQPLVPNPSVTTEKATP